MTPHERVMTTLRHQEPDRVPFNMRLVAEVRDLFKRETGQIDFEAWLGCEVRYVSLGLPQCPEGTPAREWTPLPTEQQIAQVADRVEQHHAADLAVCSAYACGVYEQAKHWIGPEATIIGPYAEPKTFVEVLDEITDWKASVYAAYAEAGVDIVWMGDDLGTQRSLVMSPTQYRDWYRPRHEHIVDRIRRAQPDVRIVFHCCGHVTPLIPDLIDIGIDVLEAVQAETMDIAALKREFGRDISFWGAVGAQSVLARTTPEQVIEGVRRTLEVMAPGGGYIAAPCHTLTEEIPWPSVLAFRDAIQRFGDYPNGWAKA